MMAKPMDFNITLAAREHPARYVVGMQMVGCLQHDEIVWTVARDGWSCPVCGFTPSEEAQQHALTITHVDFLRGTITVG